MSQIIDTSTMEDILNSTKVSPNHGRGFLGKRSEYGQEPERIEDIIPRMDAMEWPEQPAVDPLQSALDWQRQRIGKSRIEQVMSYEDCRKLFAEFWASRLDENEKLLVLPENIGHVQNILKWAIGDPSSEIPLNESIWLWGSVGAGKSVFANALHDLFMYLYETPMFRGKMWEFADMNALFVKAKFDTTAFKVLNTDYSLVLDELKETHFNYKSFGQEQRIIGDLISARYSAWKTSNVRTFITTNLEPGGDTLGGVLDDRELDRLKQMFKSIHWQGGSLRK